jgi:hypothetical protein
MGIYHQGSKLLDTLKSYHVKEAGMSSVFNHSIPIHHPFLHFHFRPTPPVWQIQQCLADGAYPVGNHDTHVAKLSRVQVQASITATIGYTFNHPPLLVRHLIK